MRNHVAVIDADVLYGIEATDLLLTLAVRRVIRIHWSSEILDEVSRNLAKRHDLNATLTEISTRRCNPALAVNQLVDQMAKRWPKFAAVVREIQPSPAQRSQRRDPYPGLDQ